ncbi:hypothetical protein [uncultured Methanobrevibacter sp.]|uniref:hypothetical protein n=1 Tax=uncultured Methanobrevibacter sp. TaxID=253161 RepID=UPI00258D30E0|nr:hypothetical protein [uncultured Methanobrevibacter sp.]
MCGEDDEFTVICPVCGEMIDAGAQSVQSAELQFSYEIFSLSRKLFYFYMF